ncbi:MAG: AtpZ/AtpI family protein [Actinobacteria bacterium]|nr:AtpZ/AtpI family protein [Actinomycetota bacterium]MCL5447585.1 AtpZ/AtpI family protein [Actinomycetota bacterium]
MNKRTGSEGSKSRRRKSEDAGDASSPGLGDFLAIGVACGISVGGGLVVGMLLDAHFRTDPYFTFTGLGVGILLAAAVVFSEVKKYL